ncbi:MAG: hypothetical protein K2H47_08930 [Muribaculaceae bacterium]|nr:hypothetical protein [Muribaculaceae bacterium]
MDALQEKLRLDSLSPDESLAYRKKLDEQISIRSGYRDPRYEGYEEGPEEGRIEGHKVGREEGLKEGLKTGLKEGREEGLKAERMEEQYMTAKRLFEMGMSVNFIEQATGLNAEEILKLIETDLEN